MILQELPDWPCVKDLESNYCITFVCQSGELELKSLLLAASLREFLPSNIELVAAIPKPESIWGRPSDLTFNLLERLGVRVANIENPIALEYPIGNKLAAIGIETSAEATIFLDSDMLCLRYFDLEEEFSLPFSAKPADVATYGKDSSVWLKLYEMVDCDLPEQTVKTTFSRDIIAPYFNAGVVCVKDGLKFSKIWIDICGKIYDCESIENKFPWLDQIGLPLAIAKLRYQYECLGEKHNFPAHLRSIDSIYPPFFCHYHSAPIIAQEPLLKSLVVSLLVKYPELKSYFEVNNHWKSLFILLESDNNITSLPKHSEANVKCNFFITGIPRTGTSLLSSLLHKHKDCVVISEPADIFTLLQDGADPSGISHYYSELRKNILARRSIENKVVNGEVIEDTAKLDRRTLYTPKVSKENFLLGTKNTIAYLARVIHLQHSMPKSKTIACIRNPYTTIASWKESFDHLRLADVSKFPIGNPNDVFLTEKQRQQLAQIDDTENIAEKRALLWRYFATVIWDNKIRLLIVHYESLIAEPSRQLSIVLQYIGAENNVWSGRLKKPLRLSDKSNVLTKDDCLAIRNICWPIASKFGYDPR